MNTPQRRTLAQRIATWHWPGWSAAANVLWTVGAVAVLLALAVTNISLRTRWHEVEDGVLWATRPAGVVAIEVVPESPARAAGLQAGDRVLSIDGQPVDRAAEVAARLHAGKAGQVVPYTVLKAEGDAPTDVAIRLAPVPQARNARLYYLLAGVGIFTLLVGTVVWLRRRGNPATLHFFWLSVAFFAVFAFSAVGRFDRLDYVFYWANAVALLVLPPLFLHFTLFFPERPASWVESRAGQRVAAHLPARVAVGRRADRGASRGRRRTRSSSSAPSPVGWSESSRSTCPPASPRVCSWSQRRSARCVRSRHAGSFGGSPGARRSARCRSRWGTRCRSRSASTRRSPCSCPSSRSA